MCRVSQSSQREVARVIAWRQLPDCWWQVELLFRAWKHTLGALHWLNLSERRNRAAILSAVAGLFVVGEAATTDGATGRRVRRTRQCAANAVPATHCEGTLEYSLSGGLAATQTSFAHLEQLFGATLLGLSRGIGRVEPLAISKTVPKTSGNGHSWTPPLAYR